MGLNACCLQPHPLPSPGAGRRALLLRGGGQPVAPRLRRQVQGPLAVRAAAAQHGPPPGSDLPEANDFDPILDYPPELPDLEDNQGVGGPTKEAGARRQGRPKKAAAPGAAAEGPAARKGGARKRSAKSAAAISPEAPTAASHGGHTEPLPEAPGTPFAGGTKEEEEASQKAGCGGLQRITAGLWPEEVPRSRGSPVEVEDDGEAGNWEILDKLNYGDRAAEEAELPHPAADFGHGSPPEDIPTGEVSRVGAGEEARVQDVE